MKLPINMYPEKKKILLSSTVFVQKEEWVGYKAFGQNLAETLNSYKDGAGLAANQIWNDSSFPPRIFAFRDDKDQIIVVVNPRITYMGKSIWGEESCLSIPDVIVKKKRYENCKINCIDVESWGKFSFYLKGNFARVVQHEMDHLNGQLLISSKNTPKTTK